MNKPLTDAALYLSGDLTGERAAAFERALAAATPEERAAFAALSDAAALTSLAGTPLRSAPASARDAIMAAAGVPPAAENKPEPVFTYIHAEEGWLPLPFPGGRYKPLFTHPQGRHTAFLLELQPGVRLPDHPHDGYEECLILSGDLINDGHRLGPGDYLRSRAGTHHDDIYSENGCVCVIFACAA
jgi:anti-sigma factor ChrR (cupin superfamily)